MLPQKNGLTNFLDSSQLSSKYFSKKPAEPKDLDP